jgi:hypothetical protein
VVLTRLKVEAEVGREEGRAELGDKLLLGVACIAPALAAEIPVKPRRVPRPVDAMPISA